MRLPHYLMNIKCYNPKCLHERNYNGKFTDDNSTITCTKCRYKLRLGKAKIKDEVCLPHEVTSLPHKENIYPKGKIIKKPQTEFIEGKKIEQPEEKDPYENPEIIIDNTERVWKFPEGTFPKE